MKKAIRNVFKNENFILSECNDGYYLYDYILGMNISMRAKTEQDAFIEALMYYQKKLAITKIDFKTLQGKVDFFVAQFYVEEEY